MGDLQFAAAGDYGGLSAEQVLVAVLQDVRFGLNAVGTLMDLAVNEDDGERCLDYWEAARDVTNSLQQHFGGNESHEVSEKTRGLLVDAGLLPEVAA